MRPTVHFFFRSSPQVSKFLSFLPDISTALNITSSRLYDRPVKAAVLSNLRWPATLRGLGLLVLQTLLVCSVLRKRTMLHLYAGLGLLLLRSLSTAPLPPQDLVCTGFFGTCNATHSNEVDCTMKCC